MLNVNRIRVHSVSWLIMVLRRAPERIKVSMKTGLLELAFTSVRNVDAKSKKMEDVHT